MPNLSDFTHTYSILAADTRTGLMGGAVQSHYFSVGSVVLWGEAGTGMAATQSLVNPAFGPEGLRLLREGFEPDEAAETLIRSDPGIDHRQFALMRKDGRSAVYTGGKCIEYAGHTTASEEEKGLYCSAQANMMIREGVPEAMKESFLSAREEKAPDGMRRNTFPRRLLAALQAAEASGGDIRGSQSAHLFVIPLKRPEEPWKERTIDLRVEDHSDPVEELARLLRIHEAYSYSDAGDNAMEAGNVDEALRAFKRAEELHPEQIELVYWHGIALGNAGETEEAGKLLRKVYAADPNWRELTKRLPRAGLITFQPEDLE